MHRRLIVIPLLVALAVGVTACGQTGPLYLPENDAFEPLATHFDVQPQ